MPGTKEEGEKETGVSTLGCLWSHVLPAPQNAHCLGIRTHLKKKEAQIPSLFWPTT